MIELPQINDLRFFEIRLDSIGGLGANLAGKMLAEAGVVGAGLNGVSFSSYGSEKRGSRVKAHIRLAYSTMRLTVNVTSGIHEDSTVLVNSVKDPEIV